MSKFLHNDNDNTKATAIPWVFSKDSQANKISHTKICRCPHMHKTLASNEI